MNGKMMAKAVALVGLLGLAACTAVPLHSREAKASGTHTAFMSNFQGADADTCVEITDIKRMMIIGASDTPVTRTWATDCGDATVYGETFAFFQESVQVPDTTAGWKPYKVVLGWAIGDGTPGAGETTTTLNTVGECRWTVSGDYLYETIDDNDDLGCIVTGTF